MKLAINEEPASSAESEYHCLWISDRWYIPVDSSGQCVGPCAEGALGFVVQLQSKDKEGHRAALKIPRLMGETHRENAYISDLMEKELRAVQDVFFNEKSTSDGLLPAIPWTRGGPMRGQIDTRRGNPEAQKWDDAIILVHFEKGKKPYFCLVKRSETPKDDSSGLDIFPHGGASMLPITSETLSQLEDRAAKVNEENPNEVRPWDRTVFIDFGGNNSSQNIPLILSKEDALQVNPTGDVWCTCIPSVAYLWAPGTLQEAISLNKRGNWEISEHFSLAQRLCKGLYALHRNRMLHADLRPANIAYRGDPTRPGNYDLSDYGSFSEIGARAAERAPTGGTVLGPVAGTERVSAFYAPERRSGREQEAADLAIISKTSGASLDIVLGWRSNLFDTNTSTASKVIQNAIKKFESLPANELAKSSLQEGDRIQIRDYIFDVIKAAEIGDMHVLRCKARSWKIYHGRIVVENTEPFDAEHWLPIPRTIELRQWSAATDLYGLGALFLYSVFRNEHPKLDENSSAVEEKFREMLNYLEGEPYFNNIWPELESLRQQIEDTLKNQKSLAPRQFGEVMFKKRKGVNTGDNGAENDQSTLRKKSIDVVQRITQTVPWSRRLVEVFGFDLGAFIFFIHFILCCLHRRSHLTGGNGWEESPFCKDRLEPPSENGGAKRSLDRLEIISKLILDNRLTALQVTPDAIPDFDPRPEPLIRAAYYHLSGAGTKAVSEGLNTVSNVNWIARLKAPFTLPNTLKETEHIFRALESAIKDSQSTDFMNKEGKSNSVGTE